MRKKEIINTQHGQKTNKALFVATAQSWYTRNEFVIKLLKKRYSKVEVICFDDKKYFVRIVKVLIKFLFLKNKKKFDLVYIGFFAQIMVPIVRFFYKGKVVADYFVSMYDTLVEDRKVVKKNSFLAKIILKFERWTLTMVDHVYVDTKQSLYCFVDNFGVNAENFTVIYVVADEKKFYPKKTKHKGINVFFYGNGQDLQGVDVILKAAKLLEDRDNVYFTIISPYIVRNKNFVSGLKLKNINLLKWVDYNKLPDMIAESDICLGGHFGITGKSMRTIAGKTFQFAAMEKALILGKTKANEELFEDGVNCIMVKTGDELALSQGIKKLVDNSELRNKIALKGYETVKDVLKNMKLIKI